MFLQHVTLKQKDGGSTDYRLLASQNGRATNGRQRETESKRKTGQTKLSCNETESNISSSKLRKTGQQTVRSFGQGKK